MLPLWPLLVLFGNVPNQPYVKVSCKTFTLKEHTSTLIHIHTTYTLTRTLASCTDSRKKHSNLIRFEKMCALVSSDCKLISIRYFRSTFFEVLSIVRNVFFLLNGYLTLKYNNLIQIKNKNSILRSFVSYLIKACLLHVFSRLASSLWTQKNKTQIVVVKIHNIHKHNITGLFAKQKYLNNKMKTK